jgi:hypothetical protein
MAEKQWCPGCSREVEGVCHHFNCAIGPNGLDAQSRSSAATEGPYAWRCCDRNFPHIYGIVTDRRVTVDAWRESGIEFQALYPGGAQATPNLLSEIRRLADAPDPYSPAPERLSQILALCDAAQPPAAPVEKSGIMQAAAKAAEKVASWSPSKRDYANRVVGGECSSAVTIDLDELQSELTDSLKPQGELRPLCLKAAEAIAELRSRAAPQTPSTPEGGK